MCQGVPPSDIKIDALGDLRILRKAIIHNGGIVTANEHAKMKAMGYLCQPGAKITLTHDQMHKIFVHVKQAIATILMDYAGRFPGAPDLSGLVDVAISGT
jgi:hypothetical protein